MGRKNNLKQQKKAERKKQEAAAAAAASANTTAAHINAVAVATAAATTASNVAFANERARIWKETLKELCEKETDGSCLHGNTSNRYHLMLDLGEFAKTVCSPGKYKSDDNNDQSVKKLSDRLIRDLLPEVKIDPEFSQFLFSTISNLMLLKGENLSWREKHMSNIFFSLGIRMKYNCMNGLDVDPGSENYYLQAKYNRDKFTYRGKINICARETKEFCNCMKEKKAEAKTTEKKGLCFGCQKEHPKIDLKYCGGCLKTQYCNKECQEKHWSKQHNCTCDHYDFQRCGKCKTFIPAELLPSHKESCSCDEHEN